MKILTAACFSDLFNTVTIRFLNVDYIRLIKVFMFKHGGVSQGLNVLNLAVKYIRRPCMVPVAPYIPMHHAVGK